MTQVYYDLYVNNQWAGQLRRKADAIEMAKNLKAKGFLRARFEVDETTDENGNKAYCVTSQVGRVVCRDDGDRVLFTKKEWVLFADKEEAEEHAQQLTEAGTISIDNIEVIKNQNDNPRDGGDIVWSWESPAQKKLRKKEDSSYGKNK